MIPYAHRVNPDQAALTNCMNWVCSVCKSVKRRLYEEMVKLSEGVVWYPESLCLLKTDRERQSTRLSEGVEILSEKKLCA